MEFQGGGSTFSLHKLMEREKLLASNECAAQNSPPPSSPDHKSEAVAASVKGVYTPLRGGRGGGRRGKASWQRGEELIECDCAQR